ncbi:MAG: tetratricopeptide repeat protein [Myxococcales bacterium]|nr:tetratricopeptide repeat protein [Myxococcales bacterium]
MPGWAAYDPAPRRPLSRGERNLAALFALSLFGILCAELLSDFEPAKLSVFFILLFWVPLLVLHELGHALMARLLGWGVHEMVLGFGPELLRLSLLGTRVSLRMVPVEGYVVPYPSDLRSARLKSALIYAAGPGAELLFVLVLLLVVGSDVMFTRTGDLGLIALQSAAVAAMIGALQNLVPHAAAGGASDGLGILMSFGQSDVLFRYRMQLPTLREAERAIARGDARAALARVERALAQYPGDPILGAMHARCLAASGQHEAALARLEALQEGDVGSDLAEAERLHAAACLVLHGAEAGTLGEAEGACRQALARQPGAPDYSMTLGEILVEQGRFEEAEKVLQQVYKNTREPATEDRCTALLARAAHGQGKAEDAERFRAASARRGG